MTTRSSLAIILTALGCRIVSSHITLPNPMVLCGVLVVWCSGMLLGLDLRHKEQP